MKWFETNVESAFEQSRARAPGIGPESEVDNGNGDPWGRLSRRSPDFRVRVGKKSNRNWKRARKDWIRLGLRVALGRLCGF